ncbi:mitogen-activated protein kinase [Trypanosoma grayi]|uniref:mitogen-activated protein kinase n=1 Tax=Trypanosoma grayi TaxID=71804 RepID=UPI0004F45276|nr:mitogen-activated protein kinase [Trypanosoma grayi]KEG10620.1 mitogen-activated protein kinase [Trypanosoma grayi]
MEGYETLGVLGEGTYGVVVKARHRATGRLVAIKKYKQAEDDDHVRKTSLREVRVLKQLRHPNVISLLDVFRRDGKLYLVFEYVEHTILQLIEEKRHGLSADEVRRYTYQLLNGVDYCHAHNIIHRDVKPENVLVSKNGLLKLCDFGFARQLTSRGKYTDYVATRWYRAPELLVGDVAYGKAVDIWAIGCIFSELSDGQPLFPGDSDLDQLSLILRTCGPVPDRMVNIFEHNSLYRRVMFPSVPVEQALRQRFHKCPKNWLDFLTSCLRTEPAERPSCAALMSMPYFTENNFRAEYEAELRGLFQQYQSATVDPSTSTTLTPTSLQHKLHMGVTEQEEGADLVLPLLGPLPPPPPLPPPQGGLESADESMSMAIKDASVKGAGTGLAGGNVIVSDAGGACSSGSPFQQLGALWSHYLGSNMSGGPNSNGELPSIGSRQPQSQSQSQSQLHLHQGVPTPLRNSMKGAAKTENKGIHDVYVSPLQSMKVTGNHTMGTVNPSSPTNPRGPKASGVSPSTSTHGRSNRKRQSVGSSKNDQMGGWKSESLKRSLKLNYSMFPTLPSGCSSPAPAPFTTTGIVVLNAPSVVRDGTTTVPKVMHNTHTNTVPNTSTTTSNKTTTNAGVGNGAANSNNNNVVKQKKKQSRRTPVPGGMTESSPGASGNTGSYHSVTGHKCSLHDVPSKR